MFIGLEISARRDERGKAFIRIAPAVIADTPRTERTAGGIAVALLAIIAFVVVAGYGIARTPDPIIRPTSTLNGAQR